MGKLQDYRKQREFKEEKVVAPPVGGKLMRFRQMQAAKPPPATERIPEAEHWKEVGVPEQPTFGEAIHAWLPFGPRKKYARKTAQWEAYQDFLRRQADPTVGLHYSQLAAEGKLPWQAYMYKEQPPPYPLAYPTATGAAIFPRTIFEAGTRAVDVGEVLPAHILRFIATREAPPKRWYDFNDFTSEILKLSGAEGTAVAMILGATLDITDWVTWLGKVAKAGDLAKIPAKMADFGRLGKSGVRIGGKNVSEAGLKAYTTMLRSEVSDAILMGVDVSSKEALQEITSKTFKRFDNATREVPTLLGRMERGKAITREMVPELGVTRRGEPLLQGIMRETIPEARIGAKRRFGAFWTTEKEKVKIAYEALNKEALKQQGIVRSVGDINEALNAGTYADKMLIGATNVKAQKMLGEALDKTKGMDVFQPVGPETFGIRKGQVLTLLDEAGNPVEHTVMEFMPEGWRVIPSEDIAGEITVTEKIIPQQQLLNETYEGTREQLCRDALRRVKEGNTKGMPAAKAWETLVAAHEGSLKRVEIQDVRSAIDRTKLQLNDLTAQRMQRMKSLNIIKQQYDEMLVRLRQAPRTPRVTEPEMLGRDWRVDVVEPRTSKFYQPQKPKMTRPIDLLSDQITRTQRNINSLDEQIDTAKSALSTMQKRAKELGKLPPAQEISETTRKVLNKSLDEMTSVQLQQEGVIPLLTPEGKFPRASFRFTDEALAILSKQEQALLKNEANRYINKNLGIDKTVGTVGEPWRRTKAVGKFHWELEKVGNKVTITTKRQKGLAKKQWVSYEPVELELSGKEIRDINLLFEGYNKLPQDAQGILLDMFKTAHPRFDKEFLHMMPEVTNTSELFLAGGTTLPDILMDRIAKFSADAVVAVTPEQMDKFADIIFKVHGMKPTEVWKGVKESKTTAFPSPVITQKTIRVRIVEKLPDAYYSGRTSEAFKRGKPVIKYTFPTTTGGKMVGYSALYGDYKDLKRALYGDYKDLKRWIGREGIYQTMSREYTEIEVLLKEGVSDEAISNVKRELKRLDIERGISEFPEGGGISGRPEPTGLPGSGEGIQPGRRIERPTIPVVEEKPTVSEGTSPAAILERSVDELVESLPELPPERAEELSTILHESSEALKEFAASKKPPMRYVTRELLEKQPTTVQNAFGAGNGFTYKGKTVIFPERARIDAEVVRHELLHVAYPLTSKSVRADVISKAMEDGRRMTEFIESEGIAALPELEYAMKQAKSMIATLRGGPSLLSRITYVLNLQLLSRHFETIAEHLGGGWHATDGRYLWHAVAQHISNEFNIKPFIATLDDETMAYLGSISDDVERIIFKSAVEGEMKPAEVWKKIRNK